MRANQALFLQWFPCNYCQSPALSSCSSARMSAQPHVEAVHTRAGVLAMCSKSDVGCKTEREHQPLEAFVAPVSSNHRQEPRPPPPTPASMVAEADTEAAQTEIGVLSLSANSIFGFKTMLVAQPLFLERFSSNLLSDIQDDVVPTFTVPKCPSVQSDETLLCRCAESASWSKPSHLQQHQVQACVACETAYCVKLFLAQLTFLSRSHPQIEQEGRALATWLMIR